MAPSDQSIRKTRRRTKSSSTTIAAAEAKATRSPRIAKYKKHKQQQHVQQVKQLRDDNTVEDLLPSSSSTTTLLDDDNDGTSSSSGCSTPKAQRFRIPEIVTCPPAPKKQRVVSNCSSLQRNPAPRPIAFFAPPDLELFFFFALHDIPV